MNVISGGVTQAAKVVPGAWRWLALKMASRFRVFGWLEQTNSSVFTQICGRRLISSKACKRAAMNIFDSGTKVQRKGFFTSSYSAGIHFILL